MSDAFEQYLHTQIKVPPAEWAFLASRLGRHTLDKHEQWLPAGQIGRHLAFVETGVLRSFWRTDKGETTNAFFQTGSMAAAFTSFFSQVPSDWAIQALGPSRLVTISYDLLQTLYARHPCWLRWGHQVLEAQFLHKSRREAAFMLASAAEHYQALRQLYPTLEEQVAQYHIASYLNITPETLSRIRAAAPVPSLLS